MGLNTAILVEHVLPDGAPGGWFTTSDISEPFDDLRLGADGILYRTVSSQADGADTPDAEPPRNLAELAYMLSRTRSAQISEEAMRHDGFLALRDGERHYLARFANGRLQAIREGGLESWAPREDPAGALAILGAAFAKGRTVASEEVIRFVAAALHKQKHG